MGIPVLLLLYARPKETQVLLDAIRDWDISNLYIAADGPRHGCPDDVERCREVRSLALANSRNHNIRTLFRDENLGPSRGVVSSIDWFFENEEAGIILEDDCIPSASFFPFCEELLEKYRDEPRVMMISGNNFLYEREMPTNNYVFTRYPHIWGWATWRRAWNLNDFDMTDWPEVRESPWLLDNCRGARDAEKYWRWIFDRSTRNGCETWDYPWVLSIWRHGGLSVTPARNLVTNIGFGPAATNTRHRPRFLNRVKYGPISLPLNHPHDIRVDEAADRWTEIEIFKTRSLLYRCGRSIARAAASAGLETELRRIIRR